MGRTLNAKGHVYPERSHTHKQRTHYTDGDMERIEKLMSADIGFSPNDKRKVIVHVQMHCLNCGYNVNKIVLYSTIILFMLRMEYRWSIK